MCGQTSWRFEVPGTWLWVEGKPADGKEKRKKLVGESEEKRVDFTILCDSHLSCSQDMGKSQPLWSYDRSQGKLSQSSHVKLFSSSPHPSVKREIRKQASAGQGGTEGGTGSGFLLGRFYLAVDGPVPSHRRVQAWRKPAGLQKTR